MTAMQRAMSWRELKREMLQNPAVAREYDGLTMEHELARSIIGRRLAKGLSQRQLAERASTRQPVISRLESGNATPSLSLLQRVANALDAEVVVELHARKRTADRTPVTKARRKARA